MSSDAVSSSARGAGFLILLQVGSRALTFALNQFLLRFLSPTLLGAAVQLELFIISAHHFARESIRVACQRQPEGGIQAAINLSYLAILGGFPIVLALAQWYLSSNHPEVPYFVEALRVCELAAVIELLSEPAFVAVQQNMLYRTRASAEASAVVVKTVATASLVLWGYYQDVELGVLPFAAGELAYCSTLTVVYLSQVAAVASKQKFYLLPTKIRASSDFIMSVFSKPLLNLGFSLYIQSAIKYLLTQGDVLISTLAPLEDQGMYALSANYGGLVARMLFRPIEDSSRNLFAQLCSSTSVSEGKAEDIIQNDKADKSQSDESSPSIGRAASILRDILRLYCLFGLIAIAIGPSVAPLLLRLVAGSRWSDSGAGQVLGTYCYSIPLLAINGVSEAFVAATANTLELHWQSIWMGVFSAIFAGSAYLFLRVLQLGATGLVYANCVNMGLRIMFNLVFVRKFFDRKGVNFDFWDILPNVYALAATPIVSALIRSTAGTLKTYGLLGELARVGAAGLGFVMFIAGTEQLFLRDWYKRFRV